MSADVSHCLAKSLGDRLIALLVRPVPTERQRLLALTIISGGVCGLAAVAFHVSIVKMTALLIGRAETAPRPWWIYLTILTPTLGGVVAGLGIRYWAPGAVGSGIPRSSLPTRVRPAAFLYATLSASSCLRRCRSAVAHRWAVEGPTVQICAGVTSFLGRVGRLSRQNQRRMASVGVAAGIAAAFNAPIAAVTFTLEEVIGDLDQTMLSGVIVAARWPPWWNGQFWGRIRC